ncbi:MAG: flagellar biosynthesis protein FliQ [Oscillospiraceae bacterium]
MSQIEILTIMKNAVYTILMASLPMLGIALVVGVIISIFQATTQINEQTLAFVPKILGILFAILLFGGFILSTVTDFTTDLFASINSMLR